MKVELTHQSGKKETIEAENSYHAHNIMWGAISIFQKDKIIRAECPDVDAMFWISGDRIFCKITDMKWLTKYQDVVT